MILEIVSLVPVWNLTSARFFQFFARAGKISQINIKTI